MNPFKTFIILIPIIFCFEAYANVYVNPYQRQNGTTVQGHFRSNPDGNFNNNWSTQGNTNPYTGQQGTRKYQNQYDDGI